MTKALVIPAALLLIGAAAAGQDGTAALPSITVRVYLRSSVPGPIIGLAKLIARDMFAQAGLRLNWWTRRQPPNPADQVITIDITSPTPETLHRGALAYALPYEGIHIRVFYDRLERLANGRAILPSLLAHVLVHEIAHILEGISRHSDEGVMKARWTLQDLREMARKPLPFERRDLELIHLGLMRLPT
ncbi:MAG TPA: hypothetical protein VFB14_00375 [Bryobacteraceae bacterium]|jgi:hypothetical protein|nr:hypothetical protein [Bryobacteraceae bacterium]